MVSYMKILFIYDVSKRRKIFFKINIMFIFTMIFIELLHVLVRIALKKCVNPFLSKTEAFYACKTLLEPNTEMGRSKIQYKSK